MSDLDPATTTATMSPTTTAAPRTGKLARTRGALSGILLVLLGAWGALVPFFGPSINFAYSPDKAWHWTAARGWYEVLPGSVAFVGGLLLLVGTTRATTLLGAWLGILAGGWFVIGPAVADQLTLGSIGHPTASNSGVRAAETLAYFDALGAVILFLAASAFGRLSVVTLRDVRVAERREAARIEAEEAAAREAAERDAADRDRYDRNQYDGDQSDRDQREQYDREQYYRAAAGHDGGASAEPGTADQRTAEQPAVDQPTAQQPAVDRPTPQPTPGGPSAGGATTGYHSALGYRDGEPTQQWAAPGYGRHDANLRSGAPGDAPDTPSTGPAPRG